MDPCPARTSQRPCTGAQIFLRFAERSLETVEPEGHAICGQVAYTLASGKERQALRQAKGTHVLLAQLCGV